LQKGEPLYPMAAGKREGNLITEFGLDRDTAKMTAVKAKKHREIDKPLISVTFNLYFFLT
jgi:hypothetical protein